MAEGFDDLESPCDSHLADDVRSQVYKVPAKECYAPRVRLEKSGDQIEERGFARAVRADEPKDLVFCHPKSDVGDRFQSAKGLGDRLDFEKGSALHRYVTTR